MVNCELWAVNDVLRLPLLFPASPSNPETSLELLLTEPFFMLNPSSGKNVWEWSVREFILETGMKNISETNVRIISQSSLARMFAGHSRISRQQRCLKYSAYFDKKKSFILCILDKNLIIRSLPSSTTTAEYSGSIFRYFSPQPFGTMILCKDLHL